MQPIDNSDLAWLIIADFLADQNKVTEAEKLRDSINNPDTEEWNREYRGLDCVGSRGDIFESNGVGGNCLDMVGGGTVAGSGSVGTGRVSHGRVGIIGNGSFGGVGSGG